MAPVRVESQQSLSPQQWGQVVVVAGIGTLLEWFDFYTYTQLNTTLEEVFFPTENETIQALSFWGVYAAAFIVRPIGALMFGHIGDTAGRNRCLVISIMFMAFSTIAIGVLPTFKTGRYHAGLAAPILLALLRILQGLAMGGEHGSAMTYISELAHKGKRGMFVAFLQMSVNIGMIIATLLAMLLQSTLSKDAMMEWGWRVPFLCASATALLGAALRKNMPEPHAFLSAARKQRGASAGGNIEAPPADGSSTKAAGSVPDLVVEVSAAAPSEASDSQSEAVPAADVAGGQGHGHGHGPSTPIVRLMRNNLVGLLLHICHMAWVSSAFYVTVSWLAKDLRTYGYPLIATQGLLITSLFPNALGLLLVGMALDRGLPALWSNVTTVVIGTALAFPVFWGVGKSLAAAWMLVSVFHLVIGGAQANSLLPCTRIYEPLSRTTGFSFGYNCGYGIIGGTSPLIVAAIKAALPGSAHAIAPALWLLCLGVLSILGDLGLSFYQPRLARPYVGRIE